MSWRNGKTPGSYVKGPGFDPRERYFFFFASVRLPHFSAMRDCTNLIIHTVIAGTECKNKFELAGYPSNDGYIGMGTLLKV